MAKLYRKTAKGQTEIETRAHRLLPRLRNALILVDGRKNSDELRPLLGTQSDETLQTLAEQGFIEDLAGQLSPSPAPASPTPLPGTAFAAPRAAPAAPATAPPMNLQVFKRDAVRALTDAVGPMAEGIGLKIERATSVEALRPLLEIGQQIIRNTRGAALAADFHKRFIEPTG